MSLAIGDHSVTYTIRYPTEVKTFRLNRSRTSWYSIYLHRTGGRLSWVT